MRFFCFILGILFSIQALAFSPEDLRTVGEKAPVQFYLFTSLTCSHCADFHKKILPTLKKEYVDTGKAQLIIVDAIQNEVGLMATQILRCLENDGARQKLENDLYAHQSQWMKRNIEDAKYAVATYAVRQRMTREQVDQCLLDKALQKTLINQQANLSKLYGVKGTPTLVMRENSKVYIWAGANKQIFRELKEVFQK